MKTTAWIVINGALINNLKGMDASLMDNYSLLTKAFPFSKFGVRFAVCGKIVIRNPGDT
jgi:hypothetical protein